LNATKQIYKLSWKGCVLGAGFKRSSPKASRTYVFGKCLAGSKTSVRPVGMFQTWLFALTHPAQTQNQSLKLSNELIYSFSIGPFWGWSRQPATTLTCFVVFCYLFADWEEETFSLIGMKKQFR
jgi:hypothetical protein